MNREDRRAKRPPLEIPAEMLAELKPVAPKRVIPKPRHAKALARVAPKQDLPT